MALGQVEQPPTFELRPRRPHVHKPARVCGARVADVYRRVCDATRARKPHLSATYLPSTRDCSLPFPHRHPIPTSPGRPPQAQGTTRPTTPRNRRRRFHAGGVSVFSRAEPPRASRYSGEEPSDEPAAPRRARSSGTGGGLHETCEPAVAATALVVVMLLTSVLRGRVRLLRRPRPLTMPSPLFLSRNPNPSPGTTNPHLSSTPVSAAMSTTGVYVPPMRRLRSVIASTNGSLAPPPSAAAQAQQTARTPEWLVDGRSLSPPSPPQPRRRDLPPLPRPPQPEHFRQQSAGYARYAYDDFSEDDSDKDMDRTSVSSKVSALCCPAIDWFTF
jgi:ATP-dependent RNA helicase DHX36